MTTTSTTTKSTTTTKATTTATTTTTSTTTPTTTTTSTTTTTTESTTTACDPNATEWSEWSECEELSGTRQRLRCDEVQTESCNEPVDSATVIMGGCDHNRAINNVEVY